MEMPSTTNLHESKILISFYRSTMHFEIYAVHTPTNALYINLVKSFKFTLKYIIISLLHVSVFTDHHQGALSVPNCSYIYVKTVSKFTSLVSKNLKIKINRTIILPVVLYGCETWSLTLREERKLRVFENMVLRRIFGPSRDEVNGEWRRLHNEKLNDLYSSPNIVRVIKSRRIRWAGHVAHMGEERGAYRVFVGKPEGRRSMGRPRLRWVDNLRMDLQEVGCVYMDWIGLAQDRDRWRTLVSAVMNRRVTWNAGNFLTSCKPVSFSRRTLHHGVSK